MKKRDLGGLISANETYNYILKNAKLKEFTIHSLSLDKKDKIESKKDAFFVYSIPFYSNGLDEDLQEDLSTAIRECLSKQVERNTKEIKKQVELL